MVTTLKPGGAPQNTHIRAGTSGPLEVLVDNDGTILVRAYGPLSEVGDPEEFRAKIATAQRVARVVADSATPISGMSESVERALAMLGCVPVAVAVAETFTEGEKPDEA